MEYLLKVQKAIAQTEYTSLMNGGDYVMGWEEAGDDLTYGIGLGSEHAVMQAIKYWVDPVIDARGNCIPDDEGDKGYCDRMNEIYKLIEEEGK